MAEVDVGLLEASGPLMMVLDRRGRILLWNRSCSELTGYTFEEVQGQVAWELLMLPEEQTTVLRVFNETMTGSPPPRMEFYWITKSGERLSIAWSVQLTRRADGEVEYMVAIGIDRTEARRAEEALRTSEARFAGIISIASDAIITIDEEQRIVIYNEGAEDIFGWKHDEVLGQSMERLIPERLRALHAEHIRRFATGPDDSRRMANRRPNIMGLRKNGEEFPAEAAISRFEVNGARLLTVVLRDVTESARIEREQRFLAEVGAALGGSLDPEQTMRRIAELTLEKMADMVVVDLIAQEGQPQRALALHRDPAKAELMNELRRFPLAEHQPHPLWQVVQEHRSTFMQVIDDATLQALARSPEHLRVLRLLAPCSGMGVPLVAHGALLGSLLLCTDDPRRIYTPEDVRLAEELAVRAALAIENGQLYQMERQATRSRDEVLAIVAHDLRNPLNAINLAAASLLRKLGPEGATEGVNRVVETIVRASDRANRLIRDLLDLTRIEAGRLMIEASRHRVDELIGDAVELLGPAAAQAGLRLDVHLPPEPISVRADRDRVLQVFSNLIGNAIKVTPSGGRISLTAERHGAEAWLAVADTGPGMTPEQLRHAFDRYWQGPKPDRQSAGLGLAIARGIVEAHDGRIWIESPPGQGATLRFTLPVAPG